MIHYEISFHNNAWQIWKCFNNGVSVSYSFFKSFKTKKGAENWARKQWDRVIWG